jgi:polyhydroxyalkanoate synthase subunit PhaC
MSMQQNIERALNELTRAQDRFRAAWLEHLGPTPAPAFETLFRALAETLAADPGILRGLQARHYQEQLALWLRHFGTPLAAPPAEGTETDPRFSAEEWRALPWFSYLRQSYALTSRWLEDLIESAHADAPTRRRLRFYVRQFIDAMAPSNFAVTNPEAIKLAFESQGETLARGLKHAMADADKGRVSMTDESAFEVGRNLALTPGAVVYQNELMQLLQYQPATEAVHERPLLIVPPCINKYYILDLQPENSFVRYAVQNGLSVFMISWRNVPSALGHTTWDDYLAHGVMQAIDVTREICASTKINTLGFCVGGTLLACALAVLRRKRKRPSASLTLLATMLDFADPGEISVYLDEAYARRCEQDFRKGGILPGGRLASAFASLRANDLVWRYVVNNYLKGRSPPAFDLLYWNSDGANLPGVMYAYYVRHMYLENALREAGRLTMCGVPVDLGRIGLPAYVLATEEDHIVPWHAAYSSAQLLGTDVSFVLGRSGHIAGVINPASRNRRSYRTGALAASAEDWLAASAEHAGSWWPHWMAWIKSRSGGQIPARSVLGGGRYNELEPAPGSYVRTKPEAAVRDVPSTA